jgi:hypothetical protein
MYEINNVGDLVRAASDMRTGGYEVELDIKPNLEKARAGDGFFLVIEVRDSEPGTEMDGEYWFWSDNTVMQVL